MASKIARDSSETSGLGIEFGFPTPGPQFPTGNQVMEHVFFLTKSQWKQAREEKQYDIIIIGSGFCGFAVAERALKNDPYTKILIIERGPFFLPEHFQNLPGPYASTLGGLSETFPWTLAAQTAQGKAGTVKWQHGMVPFFGGRSTLWSSWCPRPTDKEMYGWPDEVKEAAKRYFESAEELLHVQKVDSVDSHKDNVLLNLLIKHRPIYGKMQNKIQNLLEESGTNVRGIYRTEPAPIACAVKDIEGVDFEKFSIPGELLSLMAKQAELNREGKGAPLDVITECVVEKVHQQDGEATALETSRGVLPIRDAKLVLAMGTLPPTTLVRNSFPQAVNAGKRFSSHFISSMIARVPRADLEGKIKFGDLELGACYIAGIGKDYTQQYHIQLSILSDRNPGKNSETALRYMPDVVATASKAQLNSSKDFVIFVCAVLGELDGKNKNNWFLRNESDSDPTTNSLLQVTINNNDEETWAAMDNATFGILETCLSPGGAGKVEYWHGTPQDGAWTPERPTEKERRVDAMVHESSTLHIGTNKSAPVDLNYLVRGTKNVYVTGGALWPLGGTLEPHHGDGWSGAAPRRQPGSCQRWLEH